MHEWLVTKRKAQGSSLPEDVLNHPINCVIRHGVCPTGQFHAPGAESIPTRALCFRQIYYFHGEKEIDQWVELVREHSEGIAEEAVGVLRLVKDYVRETDMKLVRTDSIPVKFQWHIEKEEK